MEENKFGQIGVDWAKLLEAYDRAFENFPKDSTVSDVLPWQLPMWKTVGRVYDRKIVNDFTLLHWQVRCLETCCGELFLEGMEYNASETRDGCLFVMDDEEEFVFVNSGWFEKVKMVDGLGSDIYEPGRWQFGVDFANGPGLENNWGLSEAKVAKNLTWNLDETDFKCNARETIKTISEQIAEEKARILIKQLESEVRVDKKDLDKIVAELENTENGESGNRFPG